MEYKKPVGIWIRVSTEDHSCVTILPPQAKVYKDYKRLPEDYQDNWGSFKEKAVRIRAFSKRGSKVNWGK